MRSFGVSDFQVIPILEARAPPGFQVIVASSGAAKGFLQNLGSEGVQVRVLQAQVPAVAGSSELDADQVTCVFAGAAGNRALGADDLMGDHLPRNAQLAGRLLVCVVALRPFLEDKSMTDIFNMTSSPFTE
jgi:hypothetical protein